MSSTQSSTTPNYYISPDHRTESVLHAWHWILIVGGQILLPFLLITMILSHNVRRDPTLVNMIITWILFTIMLCLLYYAGHDRGPEPPFGLCLAQASLLSGAPIMSCAAGLALVFQVFLGLRNLVQKVNTTGKMTTKDDRRYKIATRWRARALVGLPYVLFLIFTITALIIGLRDRSSVTRKRAWLFCSIDGPIVVAVSVVSAILSGITLIFEVWIAFIFYRHGTQVASTKTESAFNVRIILRVIAFSIYSGLCWLSFVFLVSKSDVVPWMLTASVPLVAFVIFGSQKSVLRVWMFWVPRTSRVEMEPPSPMTPAPPGSRSGSSLAMAKLTTLQVNTSKPIIVSLPTRAHTPAAPSLDRGKSRAPTPIPRISINDHDDDDELTDVNLGKVGDVYGWEKGYERSAKSLDV